MYINVRYQEKKTKKPIKIVHKKIYIKIQYFRCWTFL